MQAAQVTPFKPAWRLAAVALAAALAACGSAAVPAQQMLQAIDAGVAAAGSDADAYLPTEMASVHARIEALRAAYVRHDYQTVLADAPALLTETKGLADAAAAEKKSVNDALERRFRMLADDIAPLSARLGERLAPAAHTGHAPHQDEAASIVAAQATWQAALDAYRAGDLKAALDKATAANTQLRALAAARNIDVPGP